MAKILVVENSLINAETIKRVIGENHTVVLAASVEEANQAMATQEFDCFVIETGLKTDADGWEFARELEKEFRRVLVITGSDMPILRKRGFGPEELLSFVGKT